MQAHEECREAQHRAQRDRHDPLLPQRRVAKPRPAVGRPGEQTAILGVVEPQHSAARAERCSAITRREGLAHVTPRAL